MGTQRTTKQVLDYKLQTVSLSVNCAPYLAIRILLQMADDTESGFPLAAHIFRNCMYVGDVLAGAHHIETALGARDQFARQRTSVENELPLIELFLIVSPLSLWLTLKSCRLWKIAVLNHWVLDGMCG